jgi:hydrogenase maturation protease
VADDGLLIIGYGNSLRGDDAVGLLAARCLARRGFHAIQTQQLTPELAERMAAARTVIFLDAHAGVAPGEVSVEAVLRSENSPLEHCFSPAGLLRLARVGYQAEPEAWLVGMGGSAFEVGDRVSRPARRAVTRAVAEVIRRANRPAIPLPGCDARFRRSGALRP